MQGPFYHDTVVPFIGADETAVTLSTTNKGLVPAARYNGLGTQFFNQVGRKLRIRAFGRMTTAATPGNFTMALLFGTGADANGTSILATAAAALAASQTNISWELEAYIHCRAAGASGSLFATGRFIAAAGLLSTNIPLLMPATAPAVTSSLDLTGSSIPSLQALRSGSTAETMQVHDFELTAMN